MKYKTNKVSHSACMYKKLHLKCSVGLGLRNLSFFFFQETNTQTEKNCPESRVVRLIYALTPFPSFVV